MGPLVAACGAPSSEPTTARTASTSGAPSISLAQAFDQICKGDISVPLEVAGSRHFVSVKVAGPAGTETLRFHVDTGGNTRGLAIAKSVADRLGVKTVADLPKSIGLGEHDVALPPGAGWIILDSEYEKFDRATRKGWSSGQIGAGFLSRFLVCIDPKNGRLGLAAPGSIHVDDAAHPPLPLLLQTRGDNGAHYPFVLVHIHDGQKVVGGYGMLLDTGATTSMIESDKIDYISTQTTHAKIDVGAAGDADMIGPKKPERVLRVGYIAITAPKSTFPDTPSIDAGPATFVERPSGTWNEMFGYLAKTNGAYGALANDVLDSYRLLIDYDRRLVWFDPTGRNPDASASLSRVGLSIRFGDDGCPTIMGVTDTNSPDTLSAVHPGDVLLSVDGVDACKAAHHEIQAALAGPPGAAKKLSLRRGTETQEVVVHTAQLLPMNP